MGDFQKLVVWQESYKFSRAIYALTNEAKISRDYGIKNQLRRAALSIPINIAEGDELNTDKQSVRHFYIAKGSTAEVKSLLLFIKDEKLAPSDKVDRLILKASQISKMLFRLIQARTQT